MPQHLTIGVAHHQFDEPGKKAVVEAVLSHQFSLITDVRYIEKGGNPFDADLVPVEISGPIQVRTRSTVGMCFTAIP